MFDNILKPTETEPNVGPYMYELQMVLIGGAHGSFSKCNEQVELALPSASHTRRMPTALWESWIATGKRR
jgi:hypothetical protein